MCISFNVNMALLAPNPDRTLSASWFPKGPSLFCALRYESISFSFAVVRFYVRTGLILQFQDLHSRIR